MSWLSLAPSPVMPGLAQARALNTPLAPSDLPAVPIILAAGKKSLGKGTDFLIAAGHLVHEAIPEALIVLLGKNSEYVTIQRPWLLNVPPVPQGAMPAWYQRAWVVCQPSVGFDSNPRTISEGMAHGCFVVGTDCPGAMATGEAFEDGLTGLLVPQRDHVALAQALIEGIGVMRAWR